MNNRIGGNTPIKRPMRIFLIRHGESVQNTGENVSLGLADHKVILTEEGKKQALQSAEYLKEKVRRLDNARVWYSPYDRTRQTMEIFDSVFHFKENMISVSEDIHLTEQQFGLFDNVPKEMWKEEFPTEYAFYDKVRRQQGKFWAKKPMGESPFDVAIRVKEFFGTIMRDYEKHGINTILVFTHGVALRTFVMQWMHYDVNWYEAESNPGNCWIRYLNGKTDYGYVYFGKGM